MGLVRERKRGGTNTVKARDCVVETSNGVGKGSCSRGGEETVLQQESVVAVEIHDNLEGDVGVGWLPVPPLPFSSVEFGVTIVIVALAVAGEEFSKTLERAEDGEVSEETLGWWVAGRAQRDVTVHRWQNFLRIEPSFEPGGAVPALFLDLIQGNTDGKGCLRLLERGGLPVRTPPGKGGLPHRKKVIGLRPIGEVRVSRKEANERVQVLIIDTRFSTKHVLSQESE